MTKSTHTERLIDELIERWFRCERDGEALLRLRIHLGMPKFRDLPNLVAERMYGIVRRGEIRISPDMNRGFLEGLRVLEVFLDFDDAERICPAAAFENRERRQGLLQEIRKRLRADFLGTDLYFHEQCLGSITEKEFEREKISFVQSWIKENTPSINGQEKRLPDDEQAAAIAAVHGHVQVVARAGSGKTTTIVNRTLFLLKHCNVAPGEMLILAFNRKAAMEIRRRLLVLLDGRADIAITEEMTRRSQSPGKLKRDDIESSAVDAVAANFKVTLPHVMTFHALAYAVVHPEESLLHDGGPGESQALSRVFQQVIDDHLQSVKSKDQIRELMLAHFREDWDRIVEGRHDQSKEEFLHFRRSLPRESIGGDHVKSYGEKVIADFLFEHNVSYKYERNHWWSGINYRPDFTIFKTPQSGLIIEYFGLSGQADYDEMSEDKRAYWKDKKDWTLIELSPVDITRKGVPSLRAILTDRLRSEGIPCDRLTEDEIWHRVRERAIDRFTKAAVGFVVRCRNQSLSPSELKEKIESYSPISDVERMFLDLAHRLYAAYLERLRASGEDDFNGLLQRAGLAIQSGQTVFRRKSGCGDLGSLRYVCIDEFQDFSDLFYRLLSAIMRKNPKVELFCVGDDWQAINGFAGSDLLFFENFAEYFGKSRRLYVSTNYRSSSAIVNIGNALMAGLGKPAVAHKKSLGRVLLSDIDDFKPSSIEVQRHPGDAITPAVLRLANKAIANDINVVMLSRQNALPWYISYPDEISGSGRGLEGYLDLIRSFLPKDSKERITISTVHKYKGLEKPLVIVLDVLARRYPHIHPDWAFSRVLGDNPEKIAKEERRLLYVAFTRAIDTLVIITDGRGRGKSPFLEEMQRKNPLSVIDWADYPPTRGKSARLVIRISNQTGKGGGPTINIKDLLKATGYRYQSVDSPCWEKSLPSKEFSIEVLKSEVWAHSANGIEVRVLDETDALVARFLVDKGEWRTLHPEN